MNSPRKHRSDIRKAIEESGDKVRRARLPKRMKLAAKILEAMERKQLRNKDLAERMNKYGSEISKWLKGDHNFTLDILSDLEEVLEISLLNLETQSSGKLYIEHSVYSEDMIKIGSGSSVKIVQMDSANRRNVYTAESI